MSGLEIAAHFYIIFSALFGPGSGQKLDQDLDPHSSKGCIVIRFCTYRRIQGFFPFLLEVDLGGIPDMELWKV